MRSLVCSSAPLDVSTVDALVETFPEALVNNVYTVAEGGPSLVGQCRSGQAPTLGPLAPGMRVVGDDGTDVDPGTVGELWLRPDGARRAYLPGMLKRWPICAPRTRTWPGHRRSAAGLASTPAT